MQGSRHAYLGRYVAKHEADVNVCEYACIKYQDNTCCALAHIPDVMRNAFWREPRITRMYNCLLMFAWPYHYSDL